MRAGLAAAAIPLLAASLGTAALAQGMDRTLAARGHEPDWLLTLGPEGARLRGLAPGLYFTAPTFSRDMADDRPRLTATADGRRLVVTVSEHLCADSMTGMPFPVGVRLDLDGRALSGCGGETLDALEGGWRVIRLGEAPVPEGVTATLVFGRDGTVSGRAGCNRLAGSYALTAESLRFGALATTRMACPPRQMAAEARLLELLGGVTRATPGEGGQMRLMAGDRQALVLDRVH